MSKVILKAENISKQYRLGLVGLGTIRHDLNRFWHQIRGKEDPYLTIGAVNDRSAKASQDYVWALRDINFEVKQGEILGIIGKNGAGKSTLLKLLSRVTTPTTGVIKSRGRIASLLEVGTGFHPELTGRENIYLNGAILGMTRAEIRKKIDEIIDFSGCEMYIDTPTKRYSSGMTVRLGFAVAAHLEPDILVVDEVLAVGDAEFQKKAIGKMQDISTGEGRTVLFVSHNMGSVQSLCSRGIFLENGSIAYEGDIEDVVGKYLSMGKKNIHQSLAERTDRKGGELFRFTGCTVLDDKGAQVKDLISGNSYTFKLAFQCEKKTPGLRFRVAIYDTKGIIRVICNNEFSSHLLDVKDGTSEHIYCTIPKFPLPNGTYNIRLSCANSSGLIDDIEMAMEFDVVGSNFYGTGKQQKSPEGVLVQHSIEVR
ncbi:ABC transporter ATP-binding protein [Aureisphaera galaxeae]|uniref:ABC transporter ATP-binding protein n=1 Tax=Aureisphaera galaxeae TaxID=1538023 RepID=UPI002350C8D6|nr:ABC transporter ATP-binding protein [Aureisphaera galaxeae]MDC8006279.1 ABC transporter ATP-binding protein [Aureisphaera galaxeae]